MTTFDLIICYLSFNAQNENKKHGSMHKLSLNRTGDLGPVYLLCQSKAYTARSCDQTKALRSVPPP